MYPAKTKGVAFLKEKKINQHTSYSNCGSFFTRRDGHDGHRTFSKNINNSPCKEGGVANADLSLHSTCVSILIC
jgi:UDP-N-acetylenolpyruvoylglucosamine reductase